MLRLPTIEEFLDSLQEHPKPFLVGLLMGLVSGFFVGSQIASNGSTELRESVNLQSKQLEFCKDKLQEENKELKRIKNLYDKTNNELNNANKIIEVLREDMKISKNCNSTTKSIEQEVKQEPNSNDAIRIESLPRKYKEFTLKSGIPWPTPDHSGSLVISQVHETYIMAEITDKNRRNQDMHISVGVNFILHGKSGLYILKLIETSYNAAKFMLYE